MTLNVRVTIMVAASVAFPVAPAPASDTPDPASVTVVANFQSELGCPGDWQPDCTQTYLSYDAEDDVWQQSFGIPLGFWEYKAALNDSWDESYGAGGALGGPNIEFAVPAPSSEVLFTYDDTTHVLTIDVLSILFVDGFEDGGTSAWSSTVSGVP